MRALTQSQAATCEGASTPPARCQCRCGGAFHGARRRAPEALAQLAPGDPHLPAQPKLDLRPPGRRPFGASPRS